MVSHLQNGLPIAITNQLLAGILNLQNYSLKIFANIKVLYSLRRVW